MISQQHFHYVSDIFACCHNEKVEASKNDTVNTPFLMYIPHVHLLSPEDKTSPFLLRSSITKFHSTHLTSLLSLHLLFLTSLLLLSCKQDKNVPTSQKSPPRTACLLQVNTNSLPFLLNSHDHKSCPQSQSLLLFSCLILFTTWLQFCLVKILLSIILLYLPIQGGLFSAYNGLSTCTWQSSLLFFLETFSFSLMSPFQYFFASFSQSSLRVLFWVSLSPLFLEWQFPQDTPHSWLFF